MWNEVASHGRKGALAGTVAKEMRLRMLRGGVLVRQDVVRDSPEAWSGHWAACAGMPGSRCTFSRALCNGARLG